MHNIHTYMPLLLSICTSIFWFNTIFSCFYISLLCNLPLLELSDKYHDSILSQQKNKPRTLHSTKAEKLNMFDDSVIFFQSCIKHHRWRRLSLSLYSSQNLTSFHPSKVETEFKYISNHVVELLSCCDFKLLVKWCEGIMASETDKVHLFSADYLEQIKQLKSSASTLRFLEKFWTWSNHSVLLTLAQFTELAVKMLEEFDSRLNQHLSMSHYPISLSFDPSLIPNSDSFHTVLSVKFCKTLDCSLHLFYDMQKLVAEEYNFSLHALQLLAANYNPLKLYWSIPKKTSNLVTVKLSPSHKNFANSMLVKGVITDVFIYPKTYYFTEEHQIHKMVSNKCTCDVTLFFKQYPYMSTIY